MKAQPMRPIDDTQPRPTSHPLSQEPVRFVAVMPLTPAEETSFHLDAHQKSQPGTMGQGARNYLGRRLRQWYQSLTQAPLPSQMSSLLQRIETRR